MTTDKQKKFILDNRQRLSVSRIAKELGVRERKVRKFLKREKGHCREKVPEVEPAEVEAAFKKQSGRSFIYRILLVLAAVAVYWNTFWNPFILDDTAYIVYSEDIRSLWPPWKFFLHTRPILHLLNALNYTFGKLNPAYYHTVNIAIHISVGLLLFGILRRTFLSKRLFQHLGNAAAELAFCSSLIWLVHPLNTQSVSYIIQRNESLMALFYLLTFYGVMRGRTSQPKKRMWHIIAVLACLGGMLTKEVGVTAPIAVLLYDRVFMSPSWRNLMQRARGLYMGLFATCVPLAINLQVALAGSGQISAGFSIPGISPLEYASTQPAVLLHYVKLSFWPTNLCFDYHWPISHTAAEILPPLLVVGVLLIGLAAWTMRTFHPASFLAMWFFIILAPTSSFMPIRDIAVEHRMYLPLISVIVLTVIFLYRFGGLLMRRYHVPRLFLRFVGFSCVVGVSLSLGFLTLTRNRVYASELAIWGDVVSKRPQNIRAHFQYGKALLRDHRPEDAINQFQAVLEVEPKNLDVLGALSAAFQEKGMPDRADAYRAEAIKLREQAESRAEVLKPQSHAETGMKKNITALMEAARLNDAAIMLTKTGMLDEAIEKFQKALELKPDFTEAYNGLGNAYRLKGDMDQAVQAFLKAINLNASFEEAYVNLGNAYLEQGRMDEAIAQFEKAIALNPDFATVHNNWGVALDRLGKYEEALAHYRLVLEKNPLSSKAHQNMSNVYLALNDVEKAELHFLESLKSDPANVKVRMRLADLFILQGKLGDADIQLSEVLRLEPEHKEALEKLLSVRDLSKSRQN